LGGINIINLKPTTRTAGLFFSTYENTKRIFSEILPVPTPVVHSSASAVAEMASCLVLAPAEVIKQNAQMLRDDAEKGGKNRLYNSTSLRALRQLGGAGSPRRLLTGYSALVARNLPFTALQFPMYEHIRAVLWRKRGRRRDGEPDVARPGQLLETGLICGSSAGSAGALAAFITTPSDVVKTRMMLFAGDGGAPTEERSSKQCSPGGKSRPGKKQSALAVTKQVYAERGIRGFFRGALFRSGWTVLGSGLYLGTYETAKVWLKKDTEPQADTGI
jgi:hypothetical protein